MCRKVEHLTPEEIEHLYETDPEFRKGLETPSCPEHDPDVDEAVEQALLDMRWREMEEAVIEAEARHWQQVMVAEGWQAL